MLAADLNARFKGEGLPTDMEKGVESGDSSADAAQGDATSALEVHRGFLLRYALMQLRDAAAAEDAVQDTLLAALEQRTGFDGRSQIRTWLTGILKHKIIDRMRRVQRDALPEGAAADSPDESLDHVLFSWSGRWVSPQADWGAPEEVLRSRQFQRVYQECSKVMPQHQARVFAMREVMELDVREICDILGITTTNCNTTLYRARIRLRECMSLNWLGSNGEQ